MKIAYAAYQPAYKNRICMECRTMLVEKDHNVFNRAHMPRYHGHSRSMKYDTIYYFEECDPD